MGQFLPNDEAFPGFVELIDGTQIPRSTAITARGWAKTSPAFTADAATQGIVISSVEPQHYPLVSAIQVAPFPSRPPWPCWPAGWPA